MTLGPDESLEDYEERFQLNYKRANCTLDPNSLKLVLLRGISEEMIETLNMLSGGDMYQQRYETIRIFFRNHYREYRKKGRASQSTSNTPSSSTFIKHKIGNMLEDFKSDMMHAFSLKMDTMLVKRKQEEAERALNIFCPRYTREHPRNECPLNFIEVCLVYEENHATDKCPSLLGLKAVYQGGEIMPEKLCFINQRRPQAVGHINKVCKVHLNLTITTIIVHP